MDLSRAKFLVCLKNIIFLKDRVMGLVDRRVIANVIYLKFSKAFDIVSHNLLRSSSGHDPVEHHG